MNLKNYFLKRKQLKAIRKTTMDINFYANMPFHCPKCYWATDTLSGYTEHLENHLIKRKKKTKKIKFRGGRIELS